MYSDGIQFYRRTNVITADPKRLVLICYEGAIDNLRFAKQKIIEKDYEAKGRALTKAQDILNELLCSLDFEKGGSIAKNLDALYNYICRRILHADVKKDLSAIDEVVGMMSELKSAWEEIFYSKGKGVKTEEIGFDEAQRRQASEYVSL